MKRFILSIIILVLASCSGLPPTEQIPPSATAQPATITPPVTPSPMPPSSPSPTSTPEPADTPQSTLSAEETKILIFDFLQDNGGCQLPCWWGWTPGETTVQTIKTLLQKFESLSVTSIFDENDGYVRLQIPLNALLLEITISYIARDGILEWFQVNAETVQKIEGNYEVVYGDSAYTQILRSYILSQVLSVYGQPSDVQIFSEKAWDLSSILLAYPESGILLEYVMPYEQNDAWFTICPLNAYLNIWGWNPERGYSLKDIVSGQVGPVRVLGPSDYYLPVEEATRLTPNEFYQIFKNPQNTTCVESPADLWPEP
jgi:hypothetical protein